MRRGWVNVTMGMIVWGAGAGLISESFDWPLGAMIGLVMLGVPFILFMFGEDTE